MSQEIERVNQAQRRERVAEAITEGFSSSRQIAARLQEKHGVSVSHATVAQDLQVIESDWQERAKDTVEKNRQKSNERYESMIRFAHSKLEDAVSVDSEGRKYDQSLPWARFITETEEKRIRLLGAAIPSKIAHTDPSGKKEYTGIPDDFKRRFFSEGLKQKEDIVEVEDIEDADVVEEIG